MRTSNYDKYPATRLDAELWQGWETIRSVLSQQKTTKKDRFILVIECYQGVYHQEIEPELQKLAPDCWINTQSLFKSTDAIEAMTYPYVTDDRLFGFRSHFSYEDFLDKERVAAARQQIEAASGFCIVYGHGAAVVSPEADLIVYIDMARWESSFVRAGTRLTAWE